MENSLPPLDAPPETPPPEPMSLTSRMLNVFAAPGEVFDEVRSRPVEHANWVAPAILLILVTCLGFWLAFSQESVRHQFGEMMDQATSKQPQGAHLTEQQFLAISIASGIVGCVLAAFLVPFMWGSILWLVGDKVLKGGFSYMKAVEVAGLASMIEVLEAVVKGLLVVVTGNFYSSTSLAMLIKNFDPTKPLQALAIYVNIMWFWLLGVRAIGLARLGRTSFAKAAMWVYGIWIAYNSVAIGLSLGLQALVKQATHR